MYQDHLSETMDVICAHPDLASRYYPEITIMFDRLFTMYQEICSTDERAAEDFLRSIRGQAARLLHRRELFWFGTVLLLDTCGGSWPLRAVRRIRNIIAAVRNVLSRQNQAVRRQKD